MDARENGKPAQEERSKTDEARPGVHSAPPVNLGKRRGTVGSVHKVKSHHHTGQISAHKSYGRQTIPPTPATVTLPTPRPTLAECPAGKFAVTRPEKEAHLQHPTELHCRSCPIDKYQPSPGYMACYSCPDGHAVAPSKTRCIGIEVRNRTSTSKNGCTHGFTRVCEGADCRCISYKQADAILGDQHCLPGKFVQQEFAHNDISGGWRRLLETPKEKICVECPKGK